MSSGGIALRLPNAFALGCTGASTSSDVSVEDVSSFRRKVPMPCSASCWRCWMEYRSGEGVRERCTMDAGSRGPCGAGGGGASEGVEWPWLRELESA